MCELFAMSAKHPATVRLSLEEFARHGGLSGPHKDGWGIAWYEERDVRLVKERSPAADSACVRFVQDHPFVSPFVISHVRKATRGAVALRNCQPFLRELGGVWHAFAHNGDLAGIDDDARFGAREFRPVGETDSERAFCVLMQQLRPLWTGDTPPSIEARMSVIEPFAATLREFGPANFLYCDGDALFAHADRRHQADGTIRPPGLWRLGRQCRGGGEYVTEGLRIAGRTDEQEVQLFASVPLTEEGWVALAQGEVRAARLGRMDRRVAAPGVGHPD
jgi:glutamine amidotransferase